MRYSEAILKLEKDPTLVFKLLEAGKTWTLKTDYDPRFPDDESLYFIVECDSEDYHDSAVEFSGNLLINDDGWEVVRHPVTWQEAIQAWVDGKSIRWEDGYVGKVYGAHDGNLGDLEIRLWQFNSERGKWYVED